MHQARLRSTPQRHRIRTAITSACLLASAIATAQHAPAPQHAPASASAPKLTFTQPQTQATLGTAYQAALENLLDINTVSYGSGRQALKYNQTGLLTPSPHTFIRAGGGYRQTWTRDASINSWSAGTLLEPLVARNTLWSVVRTTGRERGKPANTNSRANLIVQQDNQWWDQTVWIIAAWNHYLVTGDRAFLIRAYQTAIDTLAREKQLHYNPARSLYEGPAFLNDGIAGYPAPPATPTENITSFVLDYPGTGKIMVLSTNCIYAEALRSAARMAAELARPQSEADTLNIAADALTTQIQTQFWIPEKHRFGYLIHADTGSLDESQEGAGLAFSLLFRIATPEQAAALLQSAHIEPKGITDVWPAFDRYDADHPGRHNVIVWPPIQALWAEAAARQGDLPAFQREVETLASLTAHSGNHFYEIYNSTTGAIDGGWQVGHNWVSEQDQTWSATGYLRMVYAGLFGMRFTPAGLRFEPTLPATWGNVTLTDLHYRHATLTLHLHGSGNIVQASRLDGTPQPAPLIPLGLRGTHTLDIDLTEAKN